MSAEAPPITPHAAADLRHYTAASGVGSTSSSQGNRYAKVVIYFSMFDATAYFLDDNSVTKYYPVQIRTLLSGKGNITCINLQM